MDSFISLVLDVSGRARPGDITGVGADEAASLLYEYASAHPELGLSFDGQVLAPSAVVSTPVAAAAPPAPAPAPPAAAFAPDDLAAPAPGPVQTPSPWDANEAPAAYPPSGDALGAPQAVADPYSAAATPSEPWAAPSSPGSELPSWVFEGASAPPTQGSDAGVPAPFPIDAGLPPAPAPAIPSHETAFFGQPPTGDPAAPSGLPAAAGPGVPSPTPAPLPEPGADYGVPQPPSVGGFYGVADAAPPEYAGSSVADYAPAGDFVPQPQGPSATLDYVMATPSGPAPVPTRVSPLWWLAVLLFGFFGAFVAWFVNRGKPGAKTFLWVAIALIALFVLATVALVLLGGALMTGVPSAAPVAPAG